MAPWSVGFLEYHISSGRDPEKGCDILKPERIQWVGTLTDYRSVSFQKKLCLLIECGIFSTHLKQEGPILYKTMLSISFFKRFFKEFFCSGINMAKETERNKLHIVCNLEPLVDEGTYHIMSQRKAWVEHQSQLLSSRKTEWETISWLWRWWVLNSCEMCMTKHSKS